MIDLCRYSHNPVKLVSLSASNRFQENLPITIGEDCQPAASLIFGGLQNVLCSTLLSVHQTANTREVQRSVAIDRARLQDMQCWRVYDWISKTFARCSLHFRPCNLTLMAPYRRNYGPFDSSSAFGVILPLALSGHVHLPLNEDHSMSCLEAQQGRLILLRIIIKMTGNTLDFFWGLSSSLDRDYSDIWSEAWSEETCRCAEAKTCEMFLLLGTNMWIYRFDIYKYYTYSHIVLIVRQDCVSSLRLGMSYRSTQTTRSEESSASSGCGGTSQQLSGLSSCSAALGASQGERSLGISR